MNVYIANVDNKQGGFTIIHDQPRQMIKYKGVHTDSNHEIRRKEQKRLENTDCMTFSTKSSTSLRNNSNGRSMAMG